MKELRLISKKGTFDSLNIPNQQKYKTNNTSFVLKSQYFADYF
jgi:hypothetical protein